MLLEKMRPQFIKENEILASSSEILLQHMIAKIMKLIVSLNMK